MPPCFLYLGQLILFWNYAAVPARCTRWVKIWALNMEKVCSRTGKSVTLCWLAGSWMRVDKRILGYSLYVYVLCYKFTFNFGMLLVWILSSSLYLPISQSLNISLSLRDRDRDRADTIITFHPPTTENFLSTQRWLIVKCDTSLELSAQALLISTQKK